MNDLQTQAPPPPGQDLQAAPPPQLDYILLDGSGSMKDKWWDSLAAIDAFFGELQAHSLQSRTILHIFDTEDRDYIARDEELADRKPLTSSDPGAYWGFTPLYDAILLMGRRLRDLNPERASILIVTDGAENESEFCTLVQAKAILDWCRARGWQVNFIGAHFRNQEQARALGAEANQAIGVQRELLSDMAKNLGRKRTIYGRTGAPMSWTDDEQQQFGGYLAGPSAR